MDIAVIGTGYVGLVTGACFADTGNNVFCVDIDKKKIDILNSGGVPIYEPGLEDLMKRSIEEKRLSFTTDLADAVRRSSIIFLAVGTPMKDNGEANLSFVHTAARDIGRAIDGYKVIVDKSTVPVGTADDVRGIIAKETKHPFDVVSNPEFLKEGSAINDFMFPDRVVIGSSSAKATELMKELYEPFVRTFHPIIVMDIKSAEMTKYAANCFLAAKISFVNEISNLCERTGADIAAVREGIGADRRIGYEFLFPGVGYGGSCFPKDVLALIHTGTKYGIDMHLMKAVDEVNDHQKGILIGTILDHFKAADKPGALSGRTFALLGLSFKPKTDDMREAPSVVIIERLISLGASVRAYDPEAMDEARKQLGERISYAKDMYDAAHGTDGLILVTEWNEFRRPSWLRLRNELKGHVIFDGRNIYDPKRVKQEGFSYYGMGRR
ncbi:MAG: UDP-glucose/GDP-mannose dehydrogenase family protein [Spirochaetota bacterium]